VEGRTRGDHDERRATKKIVQMRLFGFLRASAPVLPHNGLLLIRMKYKRSEMKSFKREIFDTAKTDKVAGKLQDNLVTMIDLALILKQAHWNVVGPNFRSVHLQLDEIIETTRMATDDVAERIVTLGRAPDGRAEAIANGSRLETFPESFQDVATVVSTIADRLKTAIDQTRATIDEIGQLDPISEDLLIGICSRFEKHLWMIQAQEIANVVMTKPEA
jgi:starvation-inducible DNA-binding protein